MPQKPLTDEQCQEALDALVRHHGVATNAATSLKMPRGTFEHRILEARRRPHLKGVVVADDPVSMGDRIRELEALLKQHRKDTVDDEYVKRMIGGLSKGASEYTPPRWTIQPERGVGLPGVPTLMMSDFHWGERVFRGQLGGVNEFNLEIAHARLRKLIGTTADLLMNHALGGHAKYPGIVAILGGDMMSGDIHEELSESNEIPVMPCLLDLFGALTWALKTLADTFGFVFVPCVTGNHGRNTHKMRAKGRNFTNFDWLLYQFLARHFADDPRVSFYIPDGPDALYRVYGHRYLLTHGDQFRGGDGIIGALGPILRGNQKKQSRNAAINMAYDTMLLGHWHQYLPLHRAIVNGSLKGYDEYANQGNFGYEPPTQALWMTHPEHGITLHMPVYLERHVGRERAAEWVSWKEAA
jgi:hypothetical protein